MVTRLSGLDAAFLYLETPSMHMHVGSVLVLDPAGAPRPLDRDLLAAFIERRLHLAAPFRRRLARVPLNLDHPLWIDDPDFDLDFHVRRADLPAPYGLAELEELAGRIMSRPIDRRRPLWELHVVEGLRVGGEQRVALVTKTHHAVIDGVSGTELTAAILQRAADEAPPPETAWRPEAVPSDWLLLAAAGVRLAATPLELLRVGRSALGALASLVRRGGEADGQPAPFSAPQTVLNGAIGPQRAVALTTLPLAAVRDVRRTVRRAGIATPTLNDVLLSAVAGALRRFLSARGQAVDRPLVAMVPVSVRTGEQRRELGNRVSAMLVSLPVDEPDPLGRLARIAHSTTGAKQQHGAVGGDTLRKIAELAPATLAPLAARLYTSSRAADLHRPIWNTIVSNVPGPRRPLFCAGARLEAMYPLGPVHEMSGLNITLLSYLDAVHVGLNADRGLVPDVRAIGAELCGAVDELAVSVRGR